MAYIEIQDIAKWYDYKAPTLIGQLKGGKKYIKAVDGINLSIDKGDILGIIGESGCGKSTLGRMLVRLEDPTRGDVLVDGVSTNDLLRKDRKSFRRTVQIIFQNPFDTFTPRDTIRQILQRTLRIHAIGADEAARDELIHEALEGSGLVPVEDIVNRYPHELSGGQLQRISITRAMLLDPSIVIADEPVSMLDVSVRADIINLLIHLSKTRGTTMVFISHDIALTRYTCDVVAVMYLGRVVEYGLTDEVISNPQHPYTKVLISNCTSIDPEDKQDPIPIEGEPPTPLDPGAGCYFAPRCPYAVDACFKKYPDKQVISDSHYAVCDRINAIQEES